VTLAPTSNVTSAGVLAELRALYGNSDWKGVEFLVDGPGNVLLYNLFPSEGNNPFVEKVEVLLSGVYSFTAGFPTAPVGVVDATDLKCTVSFIALRVHR
jgi:hypothetical protein